MSGSASLTLEQGILQHTLGIAAMAFPAQVYVALCAAGLPPSESVGGVEAFGGGYSRVAATFALLASPTNVAANTASVEFPLASADWGSLGYFEIWSAQTGGSRLYWGGLIDPVSGNATTLDVAAGDIVRFSAGTLAVQAVPVTATASAGVSSFNTRTGAVILSNSDVVGVLPPSANPPLMDGAAAVGTSAAWARGDHVHPSDAGIAANAAAAGHNIGRNLLHNPLFRVAQRGAGPWTASGNYLADRWRLLRGAGGTDTVTIVTLLDAVRTTIGDEAAAQCLQDSFTGGAGAGDFSFIMQAIENVRRLSGKTVTLSFWANASGALKVGIEFYQAFGTGGSPSADVSTIGATAITLSNSWAHYTVTAALPSTSGKTPGTNGDSHTDINLWLSCGTTYATRASNIGVQSGTVQFWGMQLEIGSVATPLEKPDPRYDLSNCQRFFSVGRCYGSGYATAGTGVSLPSSLPVAMRATPVIVITATTGASNVTGIASVALGSGVGLAFNGSVTAVGQWYLDASFTASADL